MDREIDENSAINCKIVLLGEAGVGKTSITNRFINNVFSSNQPSTVGASFCSKIMYFPDYDKNIKFDIWDTAGQEKYRSLAKIYYQQATAAILVYDITRKSSFEEVRNFWLPQLKENSRNLTLAVAANKADMFEFEEVDEARGRSFAGEIGAIFKYTSAKNANGIIDLFEAIGTKILDPKKDESGLGSSSKGGGNKQGVKITSKSFIVANKPKKCC